MDFLTILVPTLTLAVTIERLLEVLWKTVEAITLACPRWILWLLEAFLLSLLFINGDGKQIPLPNIKDFFGLNDVPIVTVFRIVEGILAGILILCVIAIVLKAVYRSPAPTNSVLTMFYNWLKNPYNPPIVKNKYAQRIVTLIYKISELIQRIRKWLITDKKLAVSVPIESGFLNYDNYRKFKDLVSIIIAVIIGLWAATILQISLFLKLELHIWNPLFDIPLTGVAAGVLAPYAHQILVALFNLRKTGQPGISLQSKGRESNSPPASIV